MREACDHSDLTNYQIIELDLQRYHMFWGQLPYAYEIYRAGFAYLIM